MKMLKSKHFFGGVFSGAFVAAYCFCCFSPFAFQASADEIPAPAKAECVMEATSRRILFERNGEEMLPMASTTKILTAITVLENCEDLNEPFSIPQESEGVEGSSVYLKSGDFYTSEELLYGLMLRSGNDCADALARHIGGGIAEFALLMNKTAQKAGALNSRFSNPHGLPADGHYTTARDLNLIACYALENPIFRTIVATEHYDSKHWENKNKMLKNYDGAIGVKTGFTKQAGRCLVSAAERNGMTLVTTVLNCPPMYERSAFLMDEAFETYEWTKILDGNAVFSLESRGKKLSGRVREELFYPLLPEEKSLVRTEIFPSEPKSDDFGEIIGQIKIYLINRLLFSKNLYKI